MTSTEFHRSSRTRTPKSAGAPVQTPFLPASSRYPVPVVSKTLGLREIQHLSTLYGAVIVTDWIAPSFLDFLRDQCSSEAFQSIMQKQARDIRKDHGSFDSRRRLYKTSVDGRGLIDQLARKLAHEMEKHGVTPILAPAPIESIGPTGPQAAHVDLPHGDAGFACIVAVYEDTTFDLVLKYKDSDLAMRRETIPLEPGHVVMFPGNQPHAGSSFERYNLRWHFYTPLSPDQHMEQKFVYATTEMHCR